MMKIREYRTGDERGIESEDSIHLFNVAGAVRTITVGNKPVAIVGCLPFWGRVGMLWAYVSDDARKFPRMLSALCLNATLLEVDDRGYTGLVAYVNHSHTRNGRWLEKVFGMTKKCELPGGAPNGADSHLYWRNF